MRQLCGSAHTAAPGQMCAHPAASFEVSLRPPKRQIYFETLKSACQSRATAPKAHTQQFPSGLRHAAQPTRARERAAASAASEKRLKSPMGSWGAARTRPEGGSCTVPAAQRLPSLHGAQHPIRSSQVSFPCDPVGCSAHGGPRYHGRHGRRTPLLPPRCANPRWPRFAVYLQAQPSGEPLASPRRTTPPP